MKALMHSFRPAMLAAPFLAMAAFGPYDVHAGTRVTPRALALGSAATPQSAAASMGVAPAHARPGGLSYSQWAAAWWQWALQMDASAHPLLPGGVSCDQRQSGPVWFLGGAFDTQPVVRTCTIPAGTSLVFPLLNSAYFAFLSDPPETRTETFLRSQAECANVALKMTIDGATLPSPQSYLERSVIFDVQLPEGNLFGLTETEIPQLKLSPSVDFGYYLYLHPLKPGVHQLSWRASADCPFGPWAQDITYVITVAPGAKR